MHVAIHKRDAHRYARRYARETHGDTHGDTHTDTQADTHTDTQADTILKLNQTKLNSRKENHQRKEASYTHSF